MLKTQDSFERGMLFPSPASKLSKQVAIARAGQLEDGDMNAQKSEDSVYQCSS